eukprot:5678862-Alexandrium_andersonii.AAC.1
MRRLNLDRYLNVDPCSTWQSALAERLSFALETPRFARRLQHQGRNQGHADVLGVCTREKAISRSVRARP